MCPRKHGLACCNLQMNPKPTERARGTCMLLDPVGKEILYNYVAGSWAEQVFSRGSQFIVTVSASSQNFRQA